MKHSPKQGLYVNGKIRATDCRFLIDTGSTDTIINTSVYYQMVPEQRPSLENQTVRILQVDGSPLQVLGVAWVEVNIGKTIRSIRAIFADIKCQGILGMDFLLPTRGILDFQKLALVINGEEIVCTSHIGNPFIARVEVAESRKVPAGHEAIIPGRITKRNQDMTGPALIEPIQGGGELASKGLVLGRTLVDAGNEVVPIRVLNPGETDFELPEGMMVGMVMTAEVYDMSDDQTQDNQELPSHLHDLYQRSTANLDSQYHEQVKQCLMDFADVFSKSGSDIGCTDVVKHSIKTGDAKPVKQRLRRHPFGNQQEIDRQMKDLEDRGVI